jgi:hypothetical protein
MSDSWKMAVNGNVNQDFRPDLSFRFFTTFSISIIDCTFLISLGYTPHKETNKQTNKRAKEEKDKTRYDRKEEIKIAQHFSHNHHITEIKKLICNSESAVWDIGNLFSTSESFERYLHSTLVEV